MSKKSTPAPVKIISASEASEMVDELGVLAARIEPLAAREKELKGYLAAFTNGPGDINGEFYHVNVAMQTRRTPDSKKLVEKLSTFMKAFMLTRFLESITKVTTFPVVSVTALQHGSKAKAA